MNTNLPVLDWDLITRLRDLQPPDEPDVVEQLVHTFFVDSGICIAEARSAARRGDGTGVLQAAHRLRGSAMLLGARRLSCAAESVERHMRLSSHRDAAAPLQAMEAALEEVLKVLATALPDLPACDLDASA